MDPRTPSEAETTGTLPFTGEGSVPLTEEEPAAPVAAQQGVPRKRVMDVRDGADHDGLGIRLPARREIHLGGVVGEDDWLYEVTPGPEEDLPGYLLEAGGHGLDTSVDVSAPAASPGGATAGTEAAPGARRAPSAPPPPGSAGFVLRPLAALAVIALVFGMLFALYRKKGRAP